MRRTRTRVFGLLAVATAIALGGVLPNGAGAATSISYAATPGVPCDKGSLPESTQGRVPLADVQSGRAAQGYSCNARRIGTFGKTGGFRVERYKDASGHECAYYDTTPLFPKDTMTQGVEGSGTYVMDMTDPTNPVHVDTLRTPAFQSPHETMRLNQKRGLLVAALSYPTFNPGFVDVFDVTADCRHPVLKSSTPLGVLGHESGFAPDGNTLYVGSLYGHSLAAVDLTNPTVPSLLWTTFDYQPHGMSISDDGNRLYMAEDALSGGFSGLTVLDVTKVQERVLNPTVPMVSRLTWPNIGTPQNALPFTKNGHPYILEIDEFGGSPTNIGAGRIIDMANEKAPKLVSNLRLQVNQPENQTGEQLRDPGADNLNNPAYRFQGYRGHYCSLPTRVNPTMAACTFILSGLRVFDISDVKQPQEIGYYNAPVLPDSNPLHQGSFAMAAPDFALERREVWYSDANSGFHVVKLTPNARRVANLGPKAPTTGSGSGNTAGGSGSGGSGLPTTGLDPRLALLALGLLAVGGVTAARRNRRQPLS